MMKKKIETVGARASTYPTITLLDGASAPSLPNILSIQIAVWYNGRQAGMTNWATLKGRATKRGKKYPVIPL